MSQIGKSQLMKDVYEILVDGDLNTLTRKMIQMELEKKYGCSFADRKGEIKEAINQYLSVMEVISNSQKSKEENDDNPSAEETKVNSDSRKPKEEKDSNSSTEQPKVNIDSQKSKDENNDSSSIKPVNMEEKLFDDSSNSDLCDEDNLVYDGYKADSELATIVGDQIQLRKNMSKKLWRYVYEHELLEDNMIKCDDFLESLCGEKLIKKSQLYRIVTAHSKKEGKVTFKKRQPKKEKEKGVKDKPVKEKKEKAKEKSVKEKKEKVVKEKPVKKVVKEKPAKTAEKPKTVEAKETSKRSSGISKEFPVDQALSEFVGSSMCSRTTYTKKVWDYIKAHNLQNPENRREILCDEKLKTVLLKDKLDMMHIAKQFAVHLVEE